VKGNYKDIIKLATPILLGGVAQNSIAFADTAMLARYGQAELTAVGIVSVWYLVLFMAGFAFTKGTQIFTARRLGERNLEAIGAIFSNSFVILLALGLVVFLALRFGSATAMEWYFEDELARKAGTDYLETRAYGIFFSFTGSVFLAFFLGLGIMRVLVYSMLLMSTVNITLNYLLIFGKWGFPEMGISGAALASNLSEVMVAIIFVAYTLINKLHVKYSFFKRKVLSIDVAGSLASISFPIVVLTIIGLLGWIVFMYFVEKMGAFDTQVSNLVKSLYMFFGLPAWAYSAAAGTIISNLMGQKLYPRVFAAIKNIAFLSFITTLIVSLPLLIFPETFVHYTLNPELASLIPASVPVMYVMVAALLIYSVSLIIFHGIVSTGSVKVSLGIMIITVLIYLFFVFGIFRIEGLSVAEAWSSEIFYWLLLLLASTLYFRSGHWKKTDI
jgi:putative MATE family efflux protein